MDTIFKLPILLVLLFILFSLFQGMYYLAKDDGRESIRVVRVLTVRLILSLVLFGILMVGYYFGFIQPHGLAS